MTHGSLFSGIGGFDLGFERAGFETVWQVEIDEYCRRVLERHFPKAERFGDIRECGAHNLKRVDVISGGFPCQDISYAGLMRGIEDGEQSGLWREMCRVVGELRPDFIIVENVAALLGQDLGRVLADLARIGYDAEWESLSAHSFGALHRRERVFIVAYPATQRLRFPTIFGESAPKIIREQTDYGPSRLDTWDRIEMVPPRSVGMADEFPFAMDRLAHLGNAVVPQIAQWIAERIKAITA